MEKYLKPTMEVERFEDVITTSSPTGCEEDYEGPITCKLLN